MCFLAILDKSCREGYVYIEHRASQLCFVKREKGSTELEYKCPSMKSIRSKHQEIGKELETSIEPVRRTMKNRIRKLALND